MVPVPIAVWKKLRILFLFYQDDPIQKRVFETYLKMHTYQTVDFVQEKRKQYGQFNKVNTT